MLRMGLYLAAILVPAQLFFGHLTGDYVHGHQPAKFAAIEGRWRDEQPASEVLIAIPDPASKTNRLAVSVPVLGSLIASMSFTSKEIGLTDFPPQDRPPVLIPFFAFRVMVGCGMVMLLVAWLGTYLSAKGRIEQNRPLLWCIFLSFPLPHIAILTGWFTAEVGRQPWTVFGVLRTADAVTPFLTTREALISLSSSAPSTFSYSPSALSISIDCFGQAPSAVSFCPRRPPLPTAQCPCSTMPPCRTRPA
jgi:cytochrome d ubiquinol oxidase subunit I